MLVVRRRRVFWIGACNGATWWVRFSAARTRGRMSRLRPHYWGIRGRDSSEYLLRVIRFDAFGGA